MFNPTLISRISVLVTLLVLPISATLAPKAPQLPVSSYILIDADTGKVLAQQNADRRVEPASTTKMMTAYLVEKSLASGKISKEDWVEISDNAGRVEGSRIYLKADTEVPLDVLLNGMVIVSGNDASTALAEHIADSEGNFARLMNQEADRLGMENTNFVNPHGLPHPNHYSSARDLAILGRAIITDYPESYTQYSQRSFTYNNFRKENSNKLLKKNNGIDGIKTGYTRRAKYCLVSSAERDDMRLIAVMLGAKSINSRNQQSSDLLDWGFKHYETHKAYAQNATIDTLPVRRGEKKQFNMGVDEDLYITIPRGKYEDVVATVNVPDTFQAPVVKNQKVGTIELTLDGEVLVEEPIYALESVDRGSWWQRTREYLEEAFED